MITTTTTRQQRCPPARPHTLHCAGLAADKPKTVGAEHWGKHTALPPPRSGARGGGGGMVLAAHPARARALRFCFCPSPPAALFLWASSHDLQSIYSIIIRFWIAFCLGNGTMQKPPHSSFLPSGKQRCVFSHSSLLHFSFKMAGLGLVGWLVGCFLLFLSLSPAALPPCCVFGAEILDGSMDGWMNE